MTLIILMVIISIIVQIYPESILGVMRRQELRRRQVAKGDSAHLSDDHHDDDDEEESKKVSQEAAFICSVQSFHGTRWCG